MSFVIGTLDFRNYFIPSSAENYTKKMFQLLLDAYSTISVQDTALFLGMSEDDATKCEFLALLFGLKRLSWSNSCVVFS